MSEEQKKTCCRCHGVIEKGQMWVEHGRHEIQHKDPFDCVEILRCAIEDLENATEVLG